MSTPLRIVEDALRERGCRGGRGSWTCPAHEDRSPSLSVRVGEGGRVLVHCFAGCESADVLAALGLGWGDLFEESLPRPASPRPPRRPAPAAPHRGRIGLPNDDDLFWGLPEHVIDAHFARLTARQEVAPEDTREGMLRRLDALIADLEAPLADAGRWAA